ncbi:MAG: hypothetical protein KKB90_00785 [Actinobacteria bacterium]|nr:hypothetical protein [Actinomycetota bacterium]MCG2817692.1 hypothetical protein [Actinomycetes bacterium]MBU4178742.1 hypothetical protein [Actinomycetota bacterium]MBU4217484.1 hypothetical protein [Actinomycetota bacterium]MBU4358189.1 hypothetical protein [Actinomycetota bacterium]
MVDVARRAWVALTVPTSMQSNTAAEMVDREGAAVEEAVGVMRDICDSAKNSEQQVSRLISTVTHRERRCAAPARRVTETYFCSTSRERNAAGVDAAAFECHCICETGH